VNQISRECILSGDDIDSTSVIGPAILREAAVSVRMVIAFDRNCILDQLADSAQVVVELGK
jgi:hypothetical protein